jgi:hypothetical protein
VDIEEVGREEDALKVRYGALADLARVVDAVFREDEEWGEMEGVPGVCGWVRGGKGGNDETEVVYRVKGGKASFDRRTAASQP